MKVGEFYRSLLRRWPPNDVVTKKRWLEADENYALTLNVPMDYSMRKFDNFIVMSYYRVCFVTILISPMLLQKKNFDVCLLEIFTFHFESVKLRDWILSLRKIANIRTRIIVWYWLSDSESFLQSFIISTLDQILLLFNNIIIYSHKNVYIYIHYLYIDTLHLMWKK